MPKKTTPGQDLRRGVWQENPVLVQMLGLCPALAVTNTVENSLAMGLATFFVLFCSSLLVSSFRRLIPQAVRIATYVLIIATFVTVADMVLNRRMPPTRVYSGVALMRRSSCTVRVVSDDDSGSRGSVPAVAR